MLTPHYQNKAEKTHLVALVDLYLTCCGKIRKGEVFKAPPCKDCAAKLVREGRAKWQS